MRYRKHDHLDAPHGSSIVWRYMGLDKFLDLITHRRIYFTNAQNFSDGYEVSLPTNIIKDEEKRLKGKGLSGRDLEEELARYQILNSPMRELTLVNCWSLGRQESYALWKIYLGGSTAGVAIRTNFSRLKKSLENGNDAFPEDFYAGKVKYTNYLSENELSRFRLVTTKREFYGYEEELRLFILHYPQSEGGGKPPYKVSSGRHVQIDMDILIDDIYISPFVAHWFGDVIRRTLSAVAPQLTDRLIVSSIRDR